MDDGSVHWTEVLAGRHRFDEHINSYEARVLLKTLNIAARIPALRRSRLVALEDNTVTHHIFSRGRSSKWALSQILRKRAGLELAGNLELMSAWVRSARMPMDSLSRRHAGPSL